MLVVISKHSEESTTQWQWRESVLFNGKFIFVLALFSAQFYYRLSWEIYLKLTFLPSFCCCERWTRKWLISRRYNSQIFRYVCNLIHHPTDDPAHFECFQTASILCCSSLMNEIIFRVIFHSYHLVVIVSFALLATVEQLMRSREMRSTRESLRASASTNYSSDRDVVW